MEIAKCAAPCPDAVACFWRKSFLKTYLGKPVLASRRIPQLAVHASAPRGHDAHANDAGLTQLLHYACMQRQLPEHRTQKLRMHNRWKLALAKKMEDNPTGMLPLPLDFYFARDEAAE